ncbi:MAG: YIP1 family protein [Deltaproteobacteria bacterium]|uniref:YIP1 family protein n=1 Tax=Candidatus Zymogenus saltonus TaxID=2844893 RepID=A0A9D8KD58_9DELT|nr:YIP1 family protein [Candidatus Zymogenus saltonus]
MSIVEKIFGLLLKPGDTLYLLKEERNTLQQTLIYLCMLALVPFMTTFIGYTAVGFSGGPEGNIRIAVGSTLIHVMVQYILTVGGVFILALIVNLLAPKMGGKENFLQAFKTIAYACTPSLIGGFLSIHPRLSLTGSTAGFLLGLIIAIYGIYILYQGLSILMECPKTTILAYTVMTVIGGIVVWGFLEIINNKIATSIVRDTISSIL